MKIAKKNNPVSKMGSQQYTVIGNSSRTIVVNKKPSISTKSSSKGCGGCSRRKK